MRVNTKLFITVVLILFICVVVANYAYSADVNSCISECSKVCTDKYTIPTDLPVTTQQFMGKVTWEETTSSGKIPYKGNAAVLFPASWNGKISSVSLNGEVAYKDTPWKGSPLFRFTKVGSSYTKPLRFLIYSNSIIYSYTYGVEAPPVLPTDPTNPTATNLGKFNTTTSDGYRTLRTSFVGTSLGHSLKFVYSNGYSFTVPDTTRRFEIGNRVVIYRCGGKGLTTSDEKYTSHGGMGVWASTKNAGTSPYVTIYKVN